MFDYKLIGENIDRRRKEKGWTKRRLAANAGVSIPLVQSHITGGRMSLESLAKYAAVFRCSIGELTEGLAESSPAQWQYDILKVYPYNAAVAAGFRSLKDRNAPAEEKRDFAFRVYVPGFLAELDKLPQQEREAVRMRYREAASYVRIGEKLGCSREWARKLEGKALRRLGKMKCAENWQMCVLRDRQVITAVPEKPEKKGDDMRPDAAVKDGLKELSLPKGVKKRLYRNGIRTPQQLADMTEEELGSLRWFGARTVRLVGDALAKQGLAFYE